MVKGVSVLDSSISAIGNVFSEGSVDLSGNFIGNIVAESLSVKKNGSINGKIFANELLIADGGKIEGIIFAKKINIMKNAEISGEINYCYLSVEDGARAVGKFSCVNEDVIENAKSDIKNQMFEKNDNINQ